MSPSENSRSPSEQEINKNRSPFADLLRSRQESENTLLCIGLDPVMKNIPEVFKRSVAEDFLAQESDFSFVRAQYDSLIDYGKNKDAEMLLDSVVLEEFDKAIIDETHDVVSAYKPNIAFYERLGEYGVAALRRVIKYINDKDESIPVVLDAKRADIGATNEGYAEMVDVMGADAVTVNPYFGVEGRGALNPFLSLKGTGIIILCRTSNPEASETQDELVDVEGLGRVPYYIKIAHMAEKARQENPNISIVVGATVPDQLAKARGIFKGNILVPGLGKQGGKPEDLLNALNEDGFGVIANNSSAIIHASEEGDFAEKAREVAITWRESINSIRIPDIEKVVGGMIAAQREVAEMMLTAEADGKLTRRYGKPGSYTYDEERSRFPMITISQNEHEFAGAANLKDPQNQNIPLLDYFVNLRGGVPEDYELMARVLAEIEIPFDFDYITGIPNTGNAIAEALAKMLEMPYFQILEKSKEGLERKFVLRELSPDEPRPESGMKALLVDDLITGAVTKIIADDVMAEAGLEVAGHAVVYDREEGGAGEMRKMGKKIVLGLGATELFAVAVVEGKASREVYARTVKRNIRKRLAKS